ncbi:unnamed protein product (macronuclear) [Paramecium tetraurelia]|uniref:Transmembrane protein n=1 Tax=Paramecium tetraurelia TaxID=5888 RepID=A0DKU7_PARTE|nr:uncharacterized protein GSPATT00039563001 [Paramecium tetraurelia]CAK83664.1 unnamed protein product [Paramecium tetraurelia]|eukprot:XP_001451061.1 hypothetical protein (macronuclear) [Paramecium tetraurelia strain d4-2]
MNSDKQLRMTLCALQIKFGISNYLTVFCFWNIISFTGNNSKYNTLQMVIKLKNYLIQEVKFIQTQKKEEEIQSQESLRQAPMIFLICHVYQVSLKLNLNSGLLL